MAQCGGPPQGYGAPPGYGAPQGYPPQQGWQGYPMQGPPPWTCRACGLQGQAMVQEKVSLAGWIVFALLLFVCFPLCFVGLFMKDKIAVCPRCRVQA